VGIVIYMTTYQFNVISLQLKIPESQKEPGPKGALKIKGNEGYRLRVGDSRILYTINDRDQVVYIFRVKSRGAVYK